MNCCERRAREKFCFRELAIFHDKENFSRFLSSRTIVLKFCVFYTQHSNAHVSSGFVCENKIKARPNISSLKIFLFCFLFLRVFRWMKNSVEKVSQSIHQSLFRIWFDYMLFFAILRAWWKFTFPSLPLYSFSNSIFDIRKQQEKKKTKLTKKCCKSKINLCIFLWEDWSIYNDEY